MKTKDLLKLAEDPRFIPGIYNFCDRWCERCAFTSRCLTYAMEQEDEDDDPASRDIRNEAFWRRLQAIFQQTLELIATLAKEQGIDLESLDTEAVARKERRRMKEAENHPLSQAALRYAEFVRQWFETEQTLFAPLHGDSDMEGTRPTIAQLSPDETDDIRDAVEIIHWYQYQIGVKLMRGITESKDDEPWAEIDWQKVSDGSIKVALIGMDRSIMAWGKLLRYFRDKANSIQPILFQLERLRRKTEQIFPHARGFKRPGFDTLPSQFMN